MNDIFERRRLSTESGSGGDASESQRLRAMEVRLIAIAGEDGTNGKLGNVRKDVDSIKSLIRWIATGLIGSLCTAAVAIHQAGQKDGAKDREAEFLRAEVASLRAEVRDLRAHVPAFWMPRRVAPQGDDP